MRSRVNHPVTILILLSGLTLPLSACGSAEPTAAASAPVAEHRVDVPALTVGTTTLESTLQISGNLVPQTRIAILAKVPGTLSRVAVQIGDRVRAGQTVAVMDRREIDAQVDAAAAAVNVAHAALESAEATLANAVVEHERSERLLEAGAIPRQRLDETKANIAQAEATLRRARETQRDTTLASPIDGVIVERNYDAGSLVGPGDKPVVAIADLRSLKLEAGVSELEAGRLRTGMTARIAVQARPGEAFEGRLAAIAPEVDPRNRHFTIEVRTTNPGSLLAGMYATATIPTEHVSDAVAVPRDAITTRGGRRVALKVEAGAVHEVSVTEGVSNGSQVEISNGLKSGD